MEQAAVGSGLMASARNGKKTHQLRYNFQEGKGTFIQGEKIPKKERKPHHYMVRLVLVPGMLQEE